MNKLATILLMICSWSVIADDRPWWSEPYPSTFDVSMLKTQQHIAVSGTVFVDENNQTFEFKGVSIADPDKLKQQGKWSKEIFEEVAEWGANTIRLPIHPGAWRSVGKNDYFKMLDEAVVWANALDLYLILDWHSIGNMQADLYQHPMYNTSFKETLQFWQQVAFRYQNVPTIAVYELFNEPTNDFIGNGNNSLGRADWSVWRDMMEDLIDLVRSYDTKVIPLVAGFNWAYDLSPVKQMPIQRENIAYAIHPYPQKAKPKEQTTENFFMLWQQQWGFVASRAPMIATELGWSHESAPGAHVPTINNDGTYGPRIIDFMTQRGISWIAWVFDPEWSPQMISNWEYEPTEQGAFFKKVFQGDYQSANNE